MGVYHISGVGFRPGAVTVPLTAVYILQIAQALGIEEAKEFFRYSGRNYLDTSKKILIWNSV
jgi:hypothetical protein